MTAKFIIISVLWWKLVHHRSCVTLSYLWRIWQNRHRSALICDEKHIVIELFWHAWQGLPRWWVLPLDMLSMCTCYSPCVHAIAGCIGDGSGMCHLIIAQRGHLWFLHVLGSYWTTCHFPVIPRVSFLLPHVSCCYWITCHFFIGPCVVFLLVHVSISYLTTRHYVVRPRGLTLSFHVSDFK